jgi:hypothetical protein
MAQSDRVVPRPGFKLYTQPSLYEIEYPAGWVANTSQSGPNGSPYLTIWSRKPPTRGGGEFPPNFVKTDVSFESLSFEQASRRLFDTSRRGADPGRLVKRKKLVINGQEALRTWWVGGENTAGSIITLVQHPNGGTVSILSFHGEIKPAISKTIEEVHGTLRML